MHNKKTMITKVKIISMFAAVLAPITAYSDEAQKDKSLPTPDLHQALS